MNISDKALVTKSNNLVEARYHFSIWETRVFTKLVSLIQPGDADFKKYKLQIKDLVNFFGVNDNDAYVKIKAVPENLLKKVVTIPYNEDGEERFLKTGLIAQATIPKKKEGYIELSFHPDLKPYLLQLKRTFLSYDIRNVLKISSVYSIRIYELLKQYEKIGHREFDLETLKVILGVSDKYKLYGHFKSRIISKAQKDLKKHTDIYFEYKEKKIKRKVVSIYFTIKRNIHSEILTLKSKDIDEDIERIKSELKLMELTYDQVEDITKEYDKEYIEKRILYVKNQQKNKFQKNQKINNIAAYFISVLKNKNIIDYFQEKKETNKKFKEKYIKELKLEKNIKEKIKHIKILKEAEEKNKIYKLFEQHKDLKENAMESARRKTPLFFNNNEKSNEEYFQGNSLFRAAVYAYVKEKYEEEFKIINKVYKEKLNNVD